MQPVEIICFDHRGRFDYKAVAAKDGYGDTVYAVFFRESSLIIQEERKSEGMHGGFYNKVFKTHIYKVLTNKHGSRYLKVLVKDDRGRIFNPSMWEIGASPFLYKHSESFDGYICEEMKTLIEEHLSKMLGFTFKRQVSPSTDRDGWYDDETDWTYTPESLCFPFMRDAENRAFVRPLLPARTPQARDWGSWVRNLKMTLKWNGVRGVNYAKRNSETKEDFVRNLVYKSAVKTDEDMQTILNDLSLLPLFSTIDLRIGAAKAVSDRIADLFLNFGECMTELEFNAFKFMLQNASAKDVPNILETALKMKEFRTSRVEVYDGLKLSEFMKVGAEFYRLRAGHGNIYTVQALFKAVLPNERRKFASEFFNQFKAAYRQTEAAFIDLSKLNVFKEMTSDMRMRSFMESSEDLFIPVKEVLMESYAKVQFSAIPEDAMKQFLSTAKELFGSEVQDEPEVTIGTAVIPEKELKIPYINVARSPFYSKEDDLFGLIQQDADMSKFIDAAKSRPAGEFLSLYDITPNDKNLVLVSDMEDVLKKVAVQIDAKLLKLGEKITPENRIRFLRFNDHYRKYKINWKYCNLGVTENELYLYKKAGIRSKREIMEWVESKESLPPAMYQELLHDAAGIESSFRFDEISYGQPF